MIHNFIVVAPINSKQLLFALPLNFAARMIESLIKI